MEKPLTPNAWQETSEGLVRVFKFKDFTRALSFVVEVGLLAEKAGHHPDIDIRWNQVKLALVTHDSGHTITEKDYSLAELIDAI